MGVVKLSGVKAWEVSSSILSKKVKSVKKMSETRNGKSDFGIFIEKKKSKVRAQEVSS